MLNFKSFGCKIGDYSLKARLKMVERKSHEEALIMMKQKTQFDELKNKIVNENLPDDKLLVIELKILLMHKKWDDDKVLILKLKRPGLLALWLEWQSRTEEVIDTIPVPQDESDKIDGHIHPVVDDHVDDTKDSNDMDISILWVDVEKLK